MVECKQCQEQRGGTQQMLSPFLDFLLLKTENNNNKNKKSKNRQIE